jgi:hypothetical protein
MTDQIGGWATAGVGQAYGEGYNLKIRYRVISFITDD